MFRELKRKNKQVSTEECVRLLKSEMRGILSVLGDDDYPYGSPMNYWYDESDGALYFHSARIGHRPDALKKHNKVSFCIYDQGYHEEGDWALTITSVIVFGKMELITDVDTVIDICTKLSHKYTQDEEFINSEIKKFGRGTLLMKLVPEHICGKKVREA
ncbi:MAG: pyridoxamine 5'-phosphate oxidase family protein [Clostridia bacterium]|nr:pyridoxamine 5'-phosphate oxidase family protein [Clostridia bacterium]